MLLTTFSCFGFGPEQLQPESASQPAITSQPADSTPIVGGPALNLSPEECLAVAEELLAEDNYPRSRLWYEAAKGRAEKIEIRNAEERAWKKDFVGACDAALKRLDLLGKFAPRLTVSEWIQGGAPISSALANKVVVVFFFETIDPESKHAVAEMNALVERNRGKDFDAVGIACVLNDPIYQQPADIRQYLVDERITFRVGIDDGGILTLHTYKGLAVPHYAVIDRAGRLRKLGPLSPEQVDHAVRRLLADKASAGLPGESGPMPQSRAGREMIDERAPALPDSLWANTLDNLPPEMVGNPRLIRFLMDQCPFCRATAPALNRIHRDYAGRGLAVIGVFHPKPDPRPVSEREFRAAIRRLEVDFPCTLDAEWKFLRKIWLDAGHGQREFTSASFLLDKHGRIRFVHPGPDFFPSDDPAKSRQNEDYRAIRAAIEKVLSE
ncbi:MAG TPA: TlpA disulfide reductase family protein [Phycisphaerae bacterium]|nr:TlpA disulfide reductase family protein [Phycisphaerae bacterium]